MSRYSTVVFDLDGTLVDSTPDITLALNRALLSYGGQALEPEEVALLIGEGATALVESAVVAAGLYGADTRAITQAYLDTYRVSPVVESTLYPGVIEALTRLAVVKTTMAVCTNKSEAIARLVLDRLEIGKFFVTVVGGDRIPRRKPDPEHLCLTLDESDCADRSAAVFVGDSTIDQRCAEAANVAFLAVPWALEEVRGRRFRGFSDLPDAVAAGASGSQLEAQTLDTATT